MRLRAAVAIASSSDIESSPPDTASSSGASESRAARRARSTMSRSGLSGIIDKYTPSRSGNGIVAPLARSDARRYLFSRRIRTHVIRSDTLETHGPLGTLWVGLGLCAFYIALVWINTLLGFLLTPLFIVPLTWLQDKVRGKAPVRG
jgi:hypothetical protein